jgi:hypothetical protein
MSRYVDPTPQYFLDNGDLASAGLLYFYENLDYLTLKDTFNLAGVTNTNPVVLDGSARVPEIFGSGLYSVIFKSAAGVTQWTRDAVDLSSGGSSSALVSPTVSGNMTFLTAGARIRADFSNSTVSNRTIFQTSVANGSTFVSTIPNGTGTSAGVSACNAQDPGNASVIVVRADLASTGITSTRTGTGSFVPLMLSTSGVDRVSLETGGNLVPLTDNAYSFGKTSFRWSAIWAANGTIQTSDERTKKDIAPSVLGLDFINALEPISYKFIVGGNNVTPGKTEGSQPTVTPRAGVRTHWGFSAQHVKQVADSFAVDFGAHVLTDVNDPDSPQGLRYDQFIAVMVKAIQELSQQNQNLLDRIEVLEGILNV